MSIRRFDVQMMDEGCDFPWMGEVDSDHGDYMSAYDVLPLEERAAELERENTVLRENNKMLADDRFQLKAALVTLERRNEKLMSFLEMGKSCENCQHEDTDLEEEPCVGCGRFTNWQADYLRYGGIEDEK
jgi:hypothetical protein